MSCQRSLCVQHLIGLEYFFAVFSLEIYGDTCIFEMIISFTMSFCLSPSLPLSSITLQGFCLPQELMGGGDGEGATEFHDYEGGGIGEGEGVKDVSDKIENEDQVC